jgi:hypothetical protein
MQKLSVLFLSLVVLFLFFAGFYLYYVPANRASLNKYGFLVLQQVEAAMQYKLKGNESLYGSYAQHAFNRAEPAGQHRMNRWLRQLGVDSVLRDSSRNSFAASRTLQAARGTQPGMESGLLDIRNDRLYYYFRQGHDSITLTIPVTQFMSDLLGTHASDFFQSFLFLKISEEHVVTIYKNAGLPIGQRIITDSLLPNSKEAFYPGVADLHTGDLDYKLFYIPVTLGNQRFVLCGIKDAQEYAIATHAVPPGFIYPIVIVLLLLLIIFPLIKLWIMGPEEKVRLRDFTGYNFSLVAGTMVLTLIVIQVLLLRDGDTRQDQRLHLLTTKIDTAFRAELVRGYRQLAALESLPLQPDEHGRVRDWRRDGNFDVTRELVAYMQGHRDSAYYNFDRIDWVSDSGRQVINGSLQRDLDTLYIDVSKRKYYTDFVNNSCATLAGVDTLPGVPGADTAQVSIQPVVTWTEGASRMVIAKRSVVPGTLIVTLSTDLYSVNRTILPSGFGFCLIDAEGRVQVRSDSIHSLNENFIDEVADGAQFRSAMKARQELYLPATTLYGREFGLVVKPVAGLPYYLVTYYDKGYIQPVNMRILIFSLAGCATVLLLSMAMWFLFFRRQWAERPLLFGVMDYLPWITPRATAARIYLFGWIIAISYVVVTSVVVTTSFYWGPGNNQRVLILLLLTPLLVTLGLKIIIRMRRTKLSREMRLKHPFAHLIHYCLLVESLALALGVLPAALFTWYGNNQELLQSVKKEQFLLATGLDSRRPVLYRNEKVLQVGVAPKELFEDWQFRRGIYSVNQDRLLVERDSMPGPGAAFGVASTYFEVAGWLANDYYDPEYVPVLQGGSDDQRWTWTKPKMDLMRFYYQQEKGNVLQIASAMPQRYFYLSDWRKALVLGAVVALLLLGLYRVIRRVSAGMFLQKFVVGERVAGLPCFDEYCVKENLIGDAKEERRGVMCDDIVKDLEPWGPDAGLDAMEIEMLHCIRRWDGYFAVVLEGCNAKERYLLFQLACNGFMNYKNVVEIDHLLERGVLVVEDEEVRLFSRAFRAYILTHVQERELERSIMGRSPWQRFRIPFLILLMIAAAFLFFTRQEAWQRISALIAALSTSLGLLSGLFRDGGELVGAGGENEKAP